MPGAARVDDSITHGLGMVSMMGGAVVGAVIGAAVIMTAPVSLTVGAMIVGGAVAGGALSMKQLVGGVSTVKDLPGPTTGKVMVGSPNVFINGKPAAVAQAHLCTPCTGSPCVHMRSPVPVMLAEGSATVFINGQPAVRVGDKTMCGAKIKQGSSNVFIGGGTRSTSDIKDNEGLWQTGFEVVGMAALVGAGGMALAAGVGAVAIFGGVVGAGYSAFKGLGALGNAIGPGYADLLQGSAGVATLFAGPRLANAKRLDHSGSAPAPVNFMKDNDGFFTNASKRKEIDPEGHFDVVAHGNETHIEINTQAGSKLVDATEAAQYIRISDGYDGQNIRLLSCSTGSCEDGFAQQLANELQVSVVAPSDVLWAKPNGDLFIAPMRNIGGVSVPELGSQGAWRTFSPTKVVDET